MQRRGERGRLAVAGGEYCDARAAVSPGSAPESNPLSRNHAVAHFLEPGRAADAARAERLRSTPSRRTGASENVVSTTLEVVPVDEAKPFSKAAARAAERTWPLYAVLFASVSIVVGLIWDISWHRSIGRDTFWSPPHVLEQFAAVVAGTSCGWLVLRTTFGGSAGDRASGVRVWGFRGPLGAWVCIWGTLTMVVSAPFDNWWHNAYGLDVKIMSPPHMVLAWGMIAIQVGAMLMALARQNRAVPGEQRRLGVLYAVSAGILLTMHATVLMEYAAFPNDMHAARFYRLTAIGMPLILVATARASRLRMPATTTAAVYMGVVLLLMWTLQLFPATAKLAPIYNPVTRMVPPPFPLLLVVPAVAVDLLMRRVRGRDWVLATALGVAFVLLMLAAHWWWGEFLLSPRARSFVFAADQWDYYIKLGDWRYEFWNAEKSALAFARGIAIAIVTAVVTSRAGLWIGSGMTRVQR